jgi:glycosyltransferase involved in cell wall biosynthesis
MLMSGALAYVQPSYYEGFGLPPLEAMACGCPVISSNATSLPEVLGERTALYFDPKDAESLEACMTRIVDEESLRNELRNRGLAWSAQFSWAKTARQTIESLVSW